MIKSLESILNDNDDKDEISFLEHSLLLSPFNRLFNLNINEENSFNINVYENENNYSEDKINVENSFLSNSNDRKDSSLNYEKNLNLVNEIQKEGTTKEASSLIVEIKEEEKNDKKNEKEKEKDKEKKNDFISQYSFDRISSEILPKLKISNEVIEKFKKSEKTEEIEKKMSDEYINQKQKRKEKKPRKKRDKKQLGRKRKEENLNINGNNQENIVHSKNAIDNIFKSIKNKYLKNLIKFINESLKVILNNKIDEYYKYLDNNKNQELIKYLDSKKIVEDTKKENNIKLLNSTLKDILSDNVSPKFIQTSSNKNIIKNILENEKNNKCIQFLFNLTFNEWIDIFIYKKDLKEYDSLIEENIKKVFEKCRIENILEKISEKSDSNYFSCFLILTYNYQRWIITRKGRNTYIKYN